MAKALETFFPDFSPSPLQQAAIKRIQEYKEELKQYNMAVRSAMELEFMIQDQHGMLIPGVINLGKACKYLKEVEDLPYIESVVLEGELPIRLKMPEMATQYEVNVSDDSVRRPSQLAPENIAAVVEHLKTRSLKKMLLETSSLTPSALMHDEAIFSPNFEALAHADEPEDSLSYNRETSALHVNVSLCDLKGRNMFALSSDLLKHCAVSMAEIQNQAALAMLPNDNSIKRINANSSAPAGVGVVFGKYFGDNPRTSVSVRHIKSIDADNPNPQKEIYSEQTRIENRLPGADADPFVAIAISMAALVDAVRKHVHKSQKPETTGMVLKVDRFNLQDYPSYDLPITRTGLVDNFTQREHAKHLQKLLGKELYDLILSEYQTGKPASIAR